MLLWLLLMRWRRRACRICSRMMIFSLLVLRWVTFLSLMSQLRLRMLGPPVMPVLVPYHRPLRAPMSREAPRRAPPRLHLALLCPWQALVVALRPPLPAHLAVFSHNLLRISGLLVPPMVARRVPLALRAVVLDGLPGMR